MSTSVSKNLDEMQVKHLANIISASIIHLTTAIYDSNGLSKEDLQHYKKILTDEEKELKMLKQQYPEFFL